MAESPANDESDVSARSVFVVHGRNRGARDSLFSFLRALHLRPLEWGTLISDTGQASPRIDDVLSAAFRQARAVLVLFTPDDRAQLRDEYGDGPSDAATQPADQARANVLFEAGIAMGRDPDRTVLVELGQVRPFSDLAGRHVLRLNNTSQKRHELVQRLQTAGLPVDTSGSDWLAVGDFSPPTASSPQVTNQAASATPGMSGASFIEGPLTMIPGRRARGPLGLRYPAES
jgi:predicted nucleotide-binding protein